MTLEEARADLAYIRRLMEDTRRATYVSGGYFIVWGLAIGAGLLATWLAVTGRWPWPLFWTWTACVAAGGAGTAWLVHQELHEPVETPARRLIGMVWMSMGIGMMVMFFIGVGSGNLDGAHMPALSSVLVGGAFFMTGVLAGLPWLRNLSLGWWGGAAVMLAWPGMHVLWINGLMMLALYMVPGIVLLRQKRHAQETAAHD